MTPPRPILFPNVIDHARFVEAKSALGAALATGASGEPPVVPLLGPTRCGKTTLIRSFMDSTNDDPPDGGHPPQPSSSLFPHPPAAYGSLVPQPGDRDLYRAALQAVGMGWVEAEQKNALRRRISNVYRGGQVRVLFLDEISHLSEASSRLSPRAATNHLREIARLTGAALVVAGLPSFQATILQNEQFRDRAAATVSIHPYDWRDPEDADGFLAAYMSAAGQIAHREATIELGDEDAARRLYGASAGRIGPMLAVLEAAASPGGADPRGRSIGLSELRRAASTCLQQSLGGAGFFEQAPPTDTDLARSFARVMTEAGLPFEPKSAADLAAVA